jgi:hypothetical protein
MGGFVRGSLALCILAGCSGGVPPAPESASPVAAAPTAAVSPGVMAAVRAATDRSPPDVETVTLPNGERLTRATFRRGHQHVVLARRNPDGSMSTSCVNTPEAAEAFLGGKLSERAGQ